MYRWFANGLLKKSSIKEKYVAAYLLEYLSEHGLDGFIRGTVRTIRANGIKKSFSHLRRIIIYKIQSREKERLLKYLPDPPAEEEYEKMRMEARTLPYQPTISVIIPVYNTAPVLLQLAIDSIRAQIYNRWEICLVDDNSTLAGTIDLVRSFGQDGKIRVQFLPENAGISEASNAAIRMSTGEYIALLDHDDEITPDALFRVVRDLNEHGPSDILYTDECKVDEHGVLSDYFFKPNWSPELLFNSMYTGHLTVYKKQLVQQFPGPFRREFDFSQDYDLMLRASERTSSIRHIPHILYHWRITEGSAAQGDKPFARKTNLAALEDAVRRRQIPATVLGLPAANRVKMTINPLPGVSLIIPSDSLENIRTSIESIFGMTGYPLFEIVIVTNSALIRQLPPFPGSRPIITVPYDEPYNFSDKCNRGAGGASGEILIFYNDDVRPLQKDWIDNTIEYLFVPGVGGVSPKLIYEDDSIQYAGMATGVRNLMGTTLHGYPKDSIVYHNFPQLVRDVSILSGACLAIRKDFFLELGGFDSVHTPSAHSDTDLSFRILEKGKRCVYTPYATLRHIGHLSLKDHEKKVPKTRKDKADIFLLKRWIKYLPEDAYFPLPMRDYLYHDSPEAYRIHAPLKQIATGSGEDILMVSHDLSLSGAPISLFDTCMVLTANGYFVVVCSPVDGPLRRRYQEAGIPVIVDSLLLQQPPTLVRFARNFDHLFCNTIVTWPVVRQMKEFVHTIWWIQEGRLIEQFTINWECEKTLREAPLVIGLSEYSLSFIRKFNRNAIKIYNACQDIYRPETSRKDVHDRLVFTIVGSIEKRKGQDLLIEAMEHIDPVLREKAEIWIIGKDQDQLFSGLVRRLAENFSSIRFLGQVSHKECLELVKRSDVIVNASRDEPLSVAIVEAMCLEKPCVVARSVGVAELIRDRENGLIFDDGSPTDLARQLTWVLKNADRLRGIGIEAREIYKKHFTMAEFERNILPLLKVHKMAIL
jgi:GT2 family glycosyltransferase